jgi:hypothetical protein
MLVLSLTMVLLIALPSPLLADAKSKAAKEAAAYVIERFGAKAARVGVQELARRIEVATARYGPDVLQATRRLGPQALTMIEKAGANSRCVAGVLAKHGEEGATFVVRNPNALKAAVVHGDRAAVALVVSKGTALPAMESLGKPAVDAFAAIKTPQNARRLAMMAEKNADLAKIGRTPEVLGVIAKYGDPACEFVWRHKLLFVSSAVLAKFLANPEPFITGAKDITQVVAENTIKPLAETPGNVAKEGVVRIAKRTNWTAVFLAAIAIAGLLLGIWLFRRKSLPIPNQELKANFATRAMPSTPVCPNREVASSDPLPGQAAAEVQRAVAHSQFGLPRLAEAGLNRVKAEAVPKSD